MKRFLRWLFRRTEVIEPQRELTRAEMVSILMGRFMKQYGEGIRRGEEWPLDNRPQNARERLESGDLKVGHVSAGSYLNWVLDHEDTNDGLIDGE